MDLARDDGLETAVLLSLFTDRRAEPEELPSHFSKDDLRGYWGDVRPPVEGDKFGSLLWLLAREKQTTDVLNRSRQYAQDALAWMTEDKIAQRVSVATSFPYQGWLLIDIDIYRPDGTRTSYRYNYEWAKQAAKRVA